MKLNFIYLTLLSVAPLTAAEISLIALSPTAYTAVPTAGSTAHCTSFDDASFDGTSFGSTSHEGMCFDDKTDFDAYVESVLEKAEQEKWIRQEMQARAVECSKLTTELSAHPTINDPLIASLMSCSNPNSVALLKKYLPEKTGVIEILDTFPYVANTTNLGAWAKGLRPELVVEKAKIAYPAPREFSHRLSEFVKGTSEGELAFKQYIKERERIEYTAGFHPFRNRLN